MIMWQQNQKIDFFQKTFTNRNCEKKKIITRNRSCANKYRCLLQSFKNSIEMLNNQFFTRVKRLTL